MRHFVIVADRCRRLIFRWRQHRLSWCVGWCERCGGGWWRWVGIGKENAFVRDSVHFELHNQLRFTGRGVFCDEEIQIVNNSIVVQLFHFLTFTDNFELHSIQHRRAEIIHSILLLVVRRRWSMMVAVLNIRRFRAKHRLDGDFGRRHMWAVVVVVADVMVVVVVEGTFTIQVAIGAHQASLCRRNVIVVDVALIAFALYWHDRRLHGDGRGWFTL